VNKITGNIDRTVLGTGGGAFNSRMYTDAILTCEPEPDPDLLYVGTIDGFISCYNSVTFDEIYNRRISRGATGSTNNYVFGSAIAPDPVSGDPYVAHTNFWGDLMVLTKADDDRPRLEIQSYELEAPVEFGGASNYLVSIPKVFANTGCADLTFTSVMADENEFVPHIPQFAAATVNHALMLKTSTIADDLTNQVLKLVRHAQTSNDDMLSRDEAVTRDRTNSAATAFPPYLNSVDTPFVGQVVAAGDTINLALDVIQAGFTRGPHLWYLELGTDDPDFFLEDTLKKPQLQVNLVGGCLFDTTRLEFGAGANNYQIVFNTGRLADIDEDNNPYSVEIDGDHATWWMGTYEYAVSTHRIALSIDYFNGTWESWQADPNWCDNDCTPFLDVDVALGESSADGITYNPISGNMVFASGVDSVQNFDDGGGWDWDNTGSPFDNDSTMGLAVNTRTIGVVDAPAEVAGLNNLTLEIFEFTERNNRALPGWKFSLWVDHDINGQTTGSKDTNEVDQSYSAIWCTGAPSTGGGTDKVWGHIKLPFGCGHTPLKNVVLLDSDNSFYAASSGQYFDTAYNYASRAPGEYVMPGAVAARDQSMHATFVERDVASGETFDFGLAAFSLSGLANTVTKPVPEIKALANLANKWAGWGRGDVNNDDVINLSDLIYLAEYVYSSGPGPVPFKHLGDVDASGGDPNGVDVEYLFDYYFRCGACPDGDWVLPGCQ
jgi:hypothetical protein